jgi:hypothetical protein
MKIRKKHLMMKNMNVIIENTTSKPITVDKGQQKT